MLALALGMTASVHAQDSATFDVANATGAPLVALSTRPSSSDKWSSNILEVALAGGATVSITVNTSRTCMFDFRYEFKGKQPYEEFGIDVCEIDGAAFTLR